MSTLLEVTSLVKKFGGLAAVNGISFSVEERSVLGVIGPNGSGKTTLLNVINGVYKPDEGHIQYNGFHTNGIPPYELAAKGVARTFQNARVFNTVTTFQNMTIPMLHRSISRGELRDKAYSLLEAVKLARLADTPASELSGGQKKLLEFARALMIDPRLMLLDEPFAGVHPELKELLCERICDHQKTGTSMIIVSHEVPVLMSISQMVMCMASGEVVAHDNPDKVCEDELVIEAYLGHSGGES